MSAKPPSGKPGTGHAPARQLATRCIHGGATTDAATGAVIERRTQLAFLLSQMRHPQMPEPIGVLYCDPNHPTYDDAVQNQMQKAKASASTTDIRQLIDSGETWDVTESGISSS